MDCDLGQGRQPHALEAELRDEVQPVIHIQVRIKSRAFGVTIGTFDKTWAVEVGPISAVRAFDKVLHDSRGVFVRVWA